jgi:hypothetical protein
MTKHIKEANRLVKQAYALQKEKSQRSYVIAIENAIQATNEVIKNVAPKSDKDIKYRAIKDELNNMLNQ